MEDIVEIDALGLLCPLPVLRLQKGLKGVPSGTLVRLLSDDPVAVLDVRYFCNVSGHVFISEVPLDAPQNEPSRPPVAFVVRAK